jgi:anaerobic selenocysteine-containing dehydrogenase
MLGLQAKPYLQATKRLIRPDGQQRDEATIYLDLCRASGVDLFGSSVAQLALEAAVGANRFFQSEGEQPSLPQEALLSLLLRATKQGSFEELLAHPHGRLRPDHAPGSFLGARVLTDDGKVDLAPAPLLEAAKRLEGEFEEERRARGRLKLITKRAITTHNSWTHNLPEFVAGDRNTNYLYVHPEDGARLNLPDGSIADVATDTATVRVPVRHLADLMPGTVALPHGWGHQHATGLSVASKTGGVNVNLLAPDGPNRIEPVSGMAHLTGFVVDVRPAAGPRDASSWSGLPAGAHDPRA